MEMKFLIFQNTLVLLHKMPFINGILLLDRNEFFFSKQHICYLVYMLSFYKSKYFKNQGLYISVITL